MAILSPAERQAVKAEWMREPVGTCAVTKPELQAVFNAADDWLEANMISFNSALPLSGRTRLTVKQKARILTMTIRKRFEVT